MSFDDLNRICLAKKRCRAVDLTQIDPKFASLLEHVSSSFLDQVNKLNETAPRGVKIQIGFYDAPILNAWTFCENGNDYIFLSLATVVYLRDFIASLHVNGFSNNYFSYDSSPFITGAKFPFDIDKNIEVYSAVWDGDLGQKLFNEQQSLFASSQLIVALYAILHHELAHLWNGHTELMVNHGRGILDERDIQESGGRHLYALEMDADCMSIRGLLIWLIDDFKIDLTKIPDTFDYEKYNSDQTKTVFGIFFVLNYFFSILYISSRALMVRNGYRREKTLDLGKNHPPIYFRALTEIHEICSFFRDYSPELVPIIHEHLRNVVKISEKSFTSCTNEPELDVFSEQIQEAFNIYYKEAAKNWVKLKSRLLPYIRGRRLRDYVQDSIKI